MTKDKSIYIKNIYYMLSYAFQVLRQSNYEEVAAEEFEDAQDLLAAIISKGTAQQVKHGLYREYVSREESLSVIRGKINMSETIRHRIRQDNKIACEFDEFSENNLYNQIMKTTMHYLMRADRVSTERKASLKTLLLYFDGIDILDPSSIMWNRLHYHRNNLTYEMLLNVCYLVLDGMLQTTEKGEYLMSAFTDEHMARLYERFILEYYRQHHKYLSDVRSAEVKWNLIGEPDESTIKLLPSMKTDIFLRLKEKILIIDAKYYTKIMQQQYDKQTLRSMHMYQIFAYVKNTDKNNSGNVAGMLLYAKTDEDITPDVWVNMGGNMIGARTLDLNKSFKDLCAQLDTIAYEYFGER